MRLPNRRAVPCYYTGERDGPINEQIASDAYLGLFRLQALRCHWPILGEIV